MGKKLLTVAEYAKKEGVTPIAIYKRIEAGTLKAERKWGRLLIPDNK